MKIYRVEKDGLGPFQRSLKYPIELEYYDSYLYDGSERKQHPDADNGTRLQKFVFKLDNYLFGVFSKKDLYTFFSPVELGYLYANGFGICLYDVPDRYVILGKRQLCFNKNKVKSKEKLSLHKLRIKKEK